jgi:deoxyadenosine/deoxycytidine kinase
MEDRFQQFRKFVNDRVCSLGGVADHSLFRSLIFAQINLSSSDFDTFKKHYLECFKTFSFPQKVIFLKHSINQLKKNILSRGRTYEQKISGEYLNKIERGYQSFFNGESDFDFCDIDLSDLDFVKGEAAYQIILLRIKAFLVYGKNPIKPRH